MSSLSFLINQMSEANESERIELCNEIAELYEIELSCKNKESKKEQGQYYTPKDVADVMSDWLLELPGRNVCDVCCGTGNLILSYLLKLGYGESRKLIESGSLYLYDIDDTALTICKNLIGLLYGADILNGLNIVNADFLSRDVVLPSDCKVISNPPYFKIKQFSDNCEQTDVLLKSKELYSAIMEKIICNSRSSVIIAPFSFMGAEKFYSLRMKMNDHNGFIVSFDNIPGTIFSGRKHGIFNSNSFNSVRASITVTENKNKVNGYRCSPLIRFKNEERNRLLKTNVLKSFVGSRYQVVSETDSKYKKCFPELESVLDQWLFKSNGAILSDLTVSVGQYRICVPNTCRYYTVATKRDLKRTGKYTFCFNDKYNWAIAYCLFNSSFGYWWWRLNDGGIQYSQTLMLTVPIPSNVDKKECLSLAEDMVSVENDYLIYKKNAGNLQENIKFPDCYRQRLNSLFLCGIGLKEIDPSIFSILHSNSCF